MSSHLKAAEAMKTYITSFEKIRTITGKSAGVLKLFEWTITYSLSVLFFCIILRNTSKSGNFVKLVNIMADAMGLVAFCFLLRFVAIES